MRISEIFYSIQGEGRLIGVPSAFVRTSGCNLRCVWCDTPYTSWQPEGKSYGVAAILSEIEKYPARHVVVTGGEPLLAREIEELTAELKRRGHHITLAIPASRVTDRLWKTWRASGAPASATGAHRVGIRDAITAPDRRGTGKRRRASRAPGFPQAGRRW